MTQYGYSYQSKEILARVCEFCKKYGHFWGVINLPGVKRARWLEGRYLRGRAPVADNTLQRCLALSLGTDLS